METKTESKATLDLNALKTALLEGKLKPEELDAAFAQASASQPVAAAAAPRTFFTMLRRAGRGDLMAGPTPTLNPWSLGEPRVPCNRTGVAP